MKTIILGLLLTGLVFLTACESQSGKLQSNRVKILQTGEKAAIIGKLALYNVGDTVIIKYSHVGDVDRWVLDENWLEFEGLSYQDTGFPRYYKAIVL